MDLRRAITANPVAVILTALLVVVTASSLIQLLSGYPIGVDLEIPLRAAERWLGGGDPYPASAFDAPNGPDLPFLYPPFVLPIVAPLTLLPRGVVFVAWTVVLVVAAYTSCRGLGFGPLVAGLVMLWPPFAEALLGGNVQILLFAAFAALMYRGDRPRHSSVWRCSGSSRW